MAGFPESLMIDSIKEAEGGKYGGEKEVMPTRKGVGGGHMRSGDAKAAVWQTFTSHFPHITSATLMASSS